RSRKSFAEFLATAANPRAGDAEFSVKVKLTDVDGNAEYFWVAPFTNEGSSFSGELANDGELITKYKLGERITFTESDVVDWMYRDSSGTVHGNFTACALLTHEDPEDAEAFKKEYGLECADS